MRVRALAGHVAFEQGMHSAPPISLARSPVVAVLTAVASLFFYLIWQCIDGYYIVQARPVRALQRTSLN